MKYYRNKVPDISMWKKSNINDIDMLAANIALIHQIKPVLKEFEVLKVHPVAVKGLGLIATVYGKTQHARPMADVDFLVDKNELHTIEKILTDLDFKQIISGKMSFAKTRGRSFTKIDLHPEIWSASPLLDKLRGLRVCNFKGCSRRGKQPGPAQCAGVSYAATGSFTEEDPLAKRLDTIKRKVYGQGYVKIPNRVESFI